MQGSKQTHLIYFKNDIGPDVETVARATGKIIKRKTVKRKIIKITFFDSDHKKQTLRVYFCVEEIHPFVFP